MTPILYEAGATSFSSYGIGALADCASCVVTEERNGSYEMIMTYPITGKLYEEVQAERLVKCKARDIGDDQVFRIYRISKPIRGIVTVYAQHISYDLSGVALQPFSYTGTPANVMASLFANTPFTGYSNKTSSKTVKSTTPKSVRSTLGGSQGSLLDLWGGEYRWDNYKVYLNTNRGSDKGVVIEYGKNLTDLVADHDLSDVYSQLQPYATYSEGNGTTTVVVGTPVAITSVITRTKTLIKDVTELLGSSSTAPTVAQVDAAAATWLSNNPLGYETPSLSVSFVDGPHAADYPTVGIELCDTITVRYTALGVDVKAKVVQTQYDSLAEKYTELTIGAPRANMANTVANLTDQVDEMQDYPNRWDDAIRLATTLITGNLGGYVVLHEGPDGKPYEILIMDDPDINEAENVWRWNLGGLGFSSTGYAGPYATAITADGMINADFIQTGQLNADLITAGALIVRDSSNNILFSADSDNKTVQIGGFTVNDDELTATSPNGTVSLISGTIPQVKSSHGTAYASMESGEIRVVTSTDDADMLAYGAHYRGLSSGNDLMVYSKSPWIKMGDGLTGNSHNITPDGLTVSNSTMTTELGNGLKQTSKSTGEYTSLGYRQLTFNDGNLTTALRALHLVHNSGGTAETSYTITLPTGVYLLLHAKYNQPTAAATGAQLAVIGSSSGAASVVTTLSGSGTDITATTGTRSQVSIGATDGDQATLTWTVQGRTYRRLEILRIY